MPAPVMPPPMMIRSKRCSVSACRLFVRVRNENSAGRGMAIPVNFSLANSVCQRGRKGADAPGGRRHHPTASVHPAQPAQVRFVGGAADAVRGYAGQHQQEQRDEGRCVDDTEVAHDLWGDPIRVGRRAESESPSTGGVEPKIPIPETDFCTNALAAKKTPSERRPVVTSLSSTTSASIDETTDAGHDEQGDEDRASAERVSASGTASRCSETARAGGAGSEPAQGDDDQCRADCRSPLPHPHRELRRDPEGYAGGNEVQQQPAPTSAPTTAPRSTC